MPNPIAYLPPKCWPLSLLTLSLLIACGPAPQGPSGGPSPASPQPGVSASPSPGLSPGPAMSPGVSPSPGSQPGSSPQPGSPSPGASVSPANLPAGLSSIRIEAPTRFLTSVGTSVQLSLVLLDASGQPLSFSGPLPLLWSSARSDFGVDAAGKATALVAEGYSTISVRIGGTSFEASIILNVAGLDSGGGGGGGGGGGSAPTTANGTFNGSFD